MRSGLPRAFVMEQLAEAGYAPAEAPKRRKGAKPAFDPGPEHRFHMDVRDLLVALIGPASNKRNRLGVTWRTLDQGQKRSIITASGKRINPEASRAKARGVVRGVSDIWIRWTGCMGWIELKAKNNDTSDDQDAFAELMRSYGDFAEAVWDYEGVGRVERLLRAWGCPLLGSVTA